jgi:hypothetical protein
MEIVPAFDPGGSIETSGQTFKEAGVEALRGSILIQLAEGVTVNVVGVFAVMRTG